MFKRQTLATALLVAAGLLVGCGGGGGGGSTGTLSLKITDAPFPVDCVEQAIVRVVRVEARSESGWIEIPFVAPEPEVEGEEPVVPDSVEIDLYQLRAGLSESLALDEVPTGAYDEIRVVIDDAMLVFVGGGEQAFKAPSASSSGIKVKIDPPVLVAAGQTSEVVLDVNLSESFHTAGLGGEPTCDELKEGAKVIFHPVIRAINEAETALVMGTVLDESAVALGDVEVTAFVAGADLSLEPPPESVGMTFSTPEAMEMPVGSYALALDPGSYDIYLRAMGASEYTLAASGVTVVAGDMLDQDLVLPAGP